MAVQCKGMIDFSGIFYKEIYIHKNTRLKGEDESVVDFSMNGCFRIHSGNIWEHE